MFLFHDEERKPSQSVVAILFHVHGWSGIDDFQSPIVFESSPKNPPDLSPIQRPGQGLKILRGKFQDTPDVVLFSQHGALFDQSSNGTHIVPFGAGSHAKDRSAKKKNEPKKLLIAQFKSLASDVHTSCGKK